MYSIYINVRSKLTSLSGVPLRTHPPSVQYYKTLCVAVTVWASEINTRRQTDGFRIRSVIYDKLS